MRLIDAEQIPYFELAIEQSKWTTKDKIDAMPTVDAVPVIHARWVYYRGKPFCSNCNHGTAYYMEYYKTGEREIKAGYVLSHYCGYCGAKMDEEVNK